MGRRSEPDKFPLRLHASGQWCKTIRGRGHHFGTDRDKALARYVRDREDLEGGRVPRPLKELALLEELEWLNVAATDVTEAGVAEIRKALPKCQVQR
jgi:hypothetical protein